MSTPIVGSDLAAQQGYIEPSTDAAITGASLLYTKKGSNIAAKMLGKRSAKARKLGERIATSARRTGLFGAPLVVPLALPPAP